MKNDSFKPIAHEKFKKQALRNSKVRQAYEELEDEFALVAEMIKTRKMTCKTQKEVAEDMHTSQAVVARIENGFGYAQHSPTLNTLKNYANALGCRLSIKLIPSQSRNKCTYSFGKSKKNIKGH